jgi:hypothetical protein
LLKEREEKYTWMGPQRRLCPFFTRGSKLGQPLKYYVFRMLFLNLPEKGQKTTTTRKINKYTKV